MLTLTDISKSFGGRLLFEGASLQLNGGERIGLVGPNGAGKTTLFSLILGEASPDEGKVMLRRGVRTGFLPQESAPAGSETVLELATGGDEAAPEPDFQRQAKAKRILSGLAFREDDWGRPARTLSGGWIMRAHLARLLTDEPDLLMLDEPTNHLDLETLGWFQAYLRSYPGAILTISHDREFLNAIVDSIVEIAHRRLVRYRGNYDAYVVEKQARREQHLAAYRNQQREIETLQRFADRFRAKASKASQAQSKLKQIERMERIEAPEGEERTVRFRFPQPPRSGLRVMRLAGVGQAYGSHEVYRGLDLEVERGQRTVLVGPNGAGKSTLLKILAGVVPIQAGTREAGHNVKVGYFSQHRADALDPQRTVLEEIRASNRTVPEEEARTLLGSFLFRGDDVFKAVGVLSGGEKSRLALVKLLLDPPNLLLLDEPTTHLDLGSIDALIEALRPYTGSLLFVSHDVYFIRALATTVLHIRAGQVTPYAGDYQYYLDKSGAACARSGLVDALLSDHRPTEPGASREAGDGAPSRVFKTKEQKRAEAEERQAKAREKRQREAALAALEAEVLALETRQRELTAALEDPETYREPGRALELNRELAGVQEALESRTAAWDQAAEAVSAIAAEA